MSGLALHGLHVIGGDSAAGCFKQAFGSVSRLLLHADNLSCGPIPEFQDIGQWKAARRAYLKQWPAEVWDFDPWDRPFDLLGNLHRLESDEPIHVWVGTGVEDQLLVAWVIELLNRAGREPSELYLVQFERVPGRDIAATALGLITPEQMRAHPPPIRLGASTLAQYRAAWSALASHTPDSLPAFLASHPGPSTYLLRAMRHIRGRYPQKSSGLNDWDRRLLASAAKHGPKAARVLGYTLGESVDEGDDVGAWYLFWRLQRMADGQCPRPLLQMTGSRTALHGSEVRLSPFGHEVLEGRSSSYPANPVHDWIGGVELSSVRGALWFLEGERLVRG